MNASIFRFSFLVTFLVLAAPVLAAPIESVESGHATADMQKIEAFLQEQVVADQLAALGVSPAQIETRLAGLSAAQLTALAGQIDLLRAGGTIQGGNAHPWGVLECIFKPLGRFFKDLYNLLFCWGKLTTE